MSCVNNLGHGTKLVCHIDIAQMLAFIKRHFWWPFMKGEVECFVAAYDMCTRNKFATDPLLAYHKLFLILINPSLTLPLILLQDCMFLK
ncbi:hypothetical protein L3Q82_025326, partial [Scortum barcoo]